MFIQNTASPQLSSPRHGRLLQTDSRSQIGVRKRQENDILKLCVQKIKNYTKVRSIHDINNQQLLAINDHGSRYSQEQTFVPISYLEKEYHQCQQSNFRMKSLVFKLIEKIRTNKITTINPSNPLVVIWKILIFLVVSHVLFLFPLSDAFDQDIASLIPSQEVIVFLEIVLLMLDAILNLNLQSLEFGRQLLTHREVIVNYLKGGIVIDITAISGITLFLNSQFKMFKYICFFKYVSSYNYFQFAKYKVDPQQRFRNHLKLLKLLFIIVTLAHLIACLWIIVGRAYQNNWIEARGLDEDNWIEIYLTALYFAITTMTTTGYGDIVAKNIHEVGVAMGVILLSSGVFGYVLNTISVVLVDIDQENRQLKQELSAISNYLTKKGVDKTLKEKVEEYLRESWKHSQSKIEISTFNKLSQPLKTEIYQQDKGSMLLKIPFLAQNFSFNLFKAFSQFVQEFNYQPEEQVVIESGLYIVYKGKIKVASPYSERTILYNQAEGDYDGLNSLFHNVTKPLAKISSTFSTIYYLAKTDLLKSMNALDLETYHYIKSQIHTNNKYLLQKCQLCNANHSTCENLAFTPNRLQIILKHIFHKPQERIPYQRRKSIQFRVLLQLFHLKNKALLLSQQARSPQKQNSRKSLIFSPQQQSISSRSDSSDSSSQYSYDNNRTYLDEQKQQITLEYKKSQPKPSISTIPIRKKQTSFMFMLSQLATQSTRIAEVDQFEQLPNFEVMKSYTIFYPESNYENVINKLHHRKKRREKRFMKIQLQQIE